MSGFSANKNSVIRYILPAGGGADDSVQIQNVLNDLDKIIYLGSGVWNIETQINVPENSDIQLRGILESTLTPTSTFPGAYIFYTDAPSSFQNGTLASTPAIGSTVLSISITIKPVVGHFIMLVHGVSAVLYEVIASAGSASPWTVTIDRPTNQPWVSTDIVEEMSSRPSGITIDGQGIGQILGTGDQLIEVARTDRFTIRNIIHTSESGVVRSAVFGFDLACRDCLIENCASDLTGSGPLIGQNAFYAQSNDHMIFRRCITNKAYLIGISLIDCFGSRIESCHSMESGIGAAITSLGIGPDLKTSFGCYDCTISGGSAVKCGIGAAIAYVGPAYNCVIEDFAGVACTTYGIFVGAGANGTRIARCDVRNCFVGVLIDVGATGTQISGLKADGCTALVLSCSGDLDLTGLEASVNYATNGIINLAGTGRWCMRGLTLVQSNIAGHGILISGAGRLEIDGMVLSGSCLVGIYINAAATVVLRNVRITAASQGIFTASGATLILGSDCDLTGCTSPLTGTGTVIVEQNSSRSLSKSLTSGNVTLTISESQASTFRFTGSPGVDRTVTVPTFDGMTWNISNELSTEQSVTVKTSAGTGITIAPGKNAMVRCDGINIIDVITDDNTVYLAPLNGVDNAARVQAVALTMGARGKIVLQPGVWQWDSVCSLPWNCGGIEGTSGTRIVSNLTPVGNPKNAVFLVDEGTVIAATTLSANAPVGSITVTTVASLPVGAIVRFNSAVNDFHAATRVIKNVTGTGPFTLTLDEPLLEQFDSGDGVSSMTFVPTGVVIDGRGMTISGTGDRFVEIPGGWNCVVMNIFTDVVDGAMSDALFSFDVGGRGNLFYRVHADCGGVGFCGITLESNNRSRIISCVTKNSTNKGNLLLDCVGCAVYDCEDWNPSISGFSAEAELGNTIGCIDCSFINCRSYRAGGYGFFIGGGSTGTKVIGCTARHAGTAGLLTSGDATTVAGTQVLGGYYTNNGTGIWVGAGGGGTIVVGVDCSDSVLQAFHSEANCQVDGLVSRAGGNTKIIYVQTGQARLRGIDVDYTGVAITGLLSDVGTHVLLEASDFDIGTGNGVNFAGTASIRSCRVAAGSLGVVATGVVRIDDVDASGSGTPYFLNGGSFTHVVTAAGPT